MEKKSDQFSLLIQVICLELWKRFFERFVRIKLHRNIVKSLSFLEIADTAKTSNRLKVFDSNVSEIVPIYQTGHFFLCYSPTGAAICSNRDSTLQIERRFFKVANIKSILNNLSIKKIVTHATSEHKLTIVVLMSDESLYIYENIPLSSDVTWINSMQLTKHIHPIERRDRYWGDAKNHHDSNNSEYNQNCLGSNSYWNFFDFKFNFI